MTPTYIPKQSITTQKTSVRAQKIDELLQKAYGKALAKFLLQNSRERVCFLQKTCLLTNTSMKIMLEVLFLSPYNVNVKFAKKSEIFT